jgi:hypothetical protein
MSEGFIVSIGVKEYPNEVLTVFIREKNGESIDLPKTWKGFDVHVIRMPQK